MKAMIKLFGAAVLAASVTLAMSSCQKENQNDNTTPSEQAVSGIHVCVNAGIVDTKSAVVTENGVRTLVFTSGDKLKVSANLTLDLGEGKVACTLSGDLNVATIGTPATSATFEGVLTLYKGSQEVSYNFGTNNPLDLCSSATALLVHEGTTLPDEGYFEKIADTVDNLMTNCLNVSGSYDNTTHSFSLSAASPADKVMPIFNFTIESGLDANKFYYVCLLTGSDAEHASEEIMLGGIMGKTSFACYSHVPSTKQYYALRFKDGNNWKRAVFGEKALESKVYNITRMASDDPASPVMPTITGAQGTVKGQLIQYTSSSVVDVTFSGVSRSYYFNFSAPGETVHFDNLSASYHVLPFIVSYTDMFIELTGDNSIITRGEKCIDVFENNLWLSCSGESASLTLTYDEGKSGIRAHNSSALAAPGYSVDVATVDNGNGTKTSTYTVTRTAGLLNGLFTINASGDKVRFSEGNLRYLKEGLYPGQGTWSFAPHQYSIIGNSENNTKSTGEAAINQSMDLFCWGATGLIEKTGDIPIYPDANTDPYYYNGTSNLSGVSEWGNVSISNTNLTNSGSAKWRTLTKEEWVYLFNDNSKYGFGIVEGCVGVILLPDNFEDPETNSGNKAFSPAPSGGYNGNVYSGFNWKVMEAAGAVFLPAANIYTTYYMTLNDVGWAYYWSSTPYGSDRAYLMTGWIYDSGSSSDCWISYGTYNQTDFGYTRATRMAVRLVRTAN